MYQPPTVAATRAAIEAATVHGNAWQDGPLMTAIDKFIRTQGTTTADALWALDYMANTVMGFGAPAPQLSDLHKYLEG